MRTTLDIEAPVLKDLRELQRTLPREMFSGLRDSITPALTAVATLMIVFSTALFLGMQALQRRARRRQAAGS